MIILETARLTIRFVYPSDLDFVADLRADPEVMRFYPKMYTREETERWIEAKQDQYARDRHGVWLVCDRESGAPRGTVGVVQQQIGERELWEVGYMIHRPFWRQGLATEAARACRDWAFATLDTDSIHSLIRPENVPSQGVARKLGMEPEANMVPHAGFAHLVFRIDRPAWEKMIGSAPVR